MRRQHAEDNRHVGIQRRLSDPATGLRTNVIEMWRIAANDRPETNHHIELLRPRHCPCHQGNLERPRHPHHLDVVGLDPVFGQPLNAGTQQLTRDELVELRDDNAKPQSRRIMRAFSQLHSSLLLPSPWDIDTQTDGWDSPYCAHRTSTASSCAFCEHRDCPNHPFHTFFRMCPILFFFVRKYFTFAARG